MLKAIDLSEIPLKTLRHGGVLYCPLFPSHTRVGSKPQSQSFEVLSSCLLSDLLSVLTHLPVRLSPAKLGFHVDTRFSGPLSKHLISFSFCHLHDIKAVSFFSGFPGSLDSPLLFSQIQFTLGKAVLEEKLLLLFEFFCPFFYPGPVCKCGGILLAPCFVESTRAVLPVGLSIKIYLFKQFGDHWVVRRAGLCQRRKVSMLQRFLCQWWVWSVQEGQNPNQCLAGCFFSLGVSGGGAGNVFGYLRDSPFWWVLPQGGEERLDLHYHQG